MKRGTKKRDKSHQENFPHKPGTKNVEMSTSAQCRTAFRLASAKYKTLNII